MKQCFWDRRLIISCDKMGICDCIDSVGAIKFYVDQNE